MNKTTDNLILDIDTLLEESREINESYKKALRQLRKKLPLNWANTIAQKTGKTAIAIYKVIDGTNKDKDDVIVKIAIELAEEECKRKGIIINKIAQL